MLFTTFFSCIIVLALWLPSHSNAPIIIFAALYGFSSGAFVSMVPTLIAQISDIRQIGVRSGTTFCIISVAGLLGSPIAGALVTRDQGKYLYLQIFCGVTMFGGASLFVVARVLQVGFKLKKI